MSKRNCCIKDCNSSGYHLKKWHENICEIHGCNMGLASCVCCPPFKLIPFPTKHNDPQERLLWIRNVNRQSGNKMLTPCQDSRVCSKHFVDGMPTVANPYPTINLGYDLSETSHIVSARPPPLDRTNCDPTPKKKRKENPPELEIETEKDNQIHVDCPKHPDHNYVSSCSGCVNKNKEIALLRDKIKQLQWALNHQKKISCRNVVNEIIFKNDENMKFYTGIPTVAAFNALYKIIEPKIII